MSELSKGVLGFGRTAVQLMCSEDRNWEGYYSRTFVTKKAAIKSRGEEGGIINEKQQASPLTSRHVCKCYNC